jgi:hypothetical protein
MRLIFCAMFALLLSAGLCAAQESAATDPNYQYGTMMQSSLDSAESKAFYDRMMEKPQASPAAARVVLSQTDPRWNKVRLGKKTTIGGQGCLFMDIAMDMMQKGQARDPRELAQRFKALGLIDPSGRIRTQSLEIISSSLKILVRQPLSQGNGLSAIQDWLSQGASVVFRLDHSHGSHRNSTQHWLLGALDENGNFIAIDPAGGKVTLLQDFYLSHKPKELIAYGGD